MAVFCTGVPELKEYSWKKYNAVEETNTYTFWEKWSANVSTRSGVVQGSGAPDSEDTGYWYGNTGDFSELHMTQSWATAYTINSDNKFVLTDPETETLTTGGAYSRWGIPAGSYYGDSGPTDTLYYTSTLRYFGISVSTVEANPDDNGYAYRATVVYTIPGHDYSLTYEDDVTTYSKGSTSYGTVSSTNSSAYPSNGYKDGYWYVKTKTESTTGWAKGSTLQDTVTSFSPVAYPEDGYQDGYWYVRV